MLRYLASTIVIALLTACASAPSALGVPAGTASTRQDLSHAPHNCCIWWNKMHLTLRYPSQPTKDAVLRYWGPKGYHLTQFYCQNGSQLTATLERTWGNVTALMHARYSFTTASPGPDRCAIDAVLNNTGSPPIAILKIRIQ
jgi:hypothetical protein